MPNKFSSIQRMLEFAKTRYYNNLFGTVIIEFGDMFWYYIREDGDGSYRLVMSSQTNLSNV